MQSTVQTPGSPDEIFTQEGGYRVGRSALLSFNASWPFGSVEVRSGQLVLYCITRRLLFPVAAVANISVYHGFFSVGVRIEHTIPDYPRFVVFWTREPDKLLQRLKDAGYPIQ
jgi:hypothetical protein